jgi:hypothetical protein
MTETVSGRVYTSTRVRGFAPWNPRQETLDVVRQVQGVLREYQAQLPMTNRQIFYRLVGTQGYPKTEQAYARLCEYLNRARRAQMISFSSIRDDGTQSQGYEGWDSPAQWMRGVRSSANRYRHDLTDGQPVHTELWVEAGGMVPQAAAVATDYGVITYSAGGFNGLTDKYETAQRLASQEIPSIVLHCGDYDPSGLSILDSLAEDVSALALGLDPMTEVEFRRVLVTPRQIADYQLPSAPQKGTDNRGDYMAETVQAEALPPDTLQAEIRAAIEDIIDHDALQAAIELGDDERQQILTTLNQLS